MQPASVEFLHPANVGDVAGPNFSGQAASFACGAVVRMSLRIDESQLITEAKFRAAGCSVLVAAASRLTESAIGQSTAEAASIARLFETGQQELLVPEGGDCAALATSALLAAITQYSDSVRETWEGEEALICTCFSVSERRIENEIETKRLATIADVTRECNAGAGCRSCYPLIEELLIIREQA